MFKLKDLLLICANNIQIRLAFTGSIIAAYRAATAIYFGMISTAVCLQVYNWTVQCAKYAIKTARDGSVCEVKPF